MKMIIFGVLSLFCWFLFSCSCLSPSSSCFPDSNKEKVPSGKEDGPRCQQNGDDNSTSYCVEDGVERCFMSKDGVEGGVSFENQNNSQNKDADDENNRVFHRKKKKRTIIRNNDIVGQNIKTGKQDEDQDHQTNDRMKINKLDARASRNHLLRKAAKNDYKKLKSHLVEVIGASRPKSSWIFDKNGDDCKRIKERKLKNKAMENYKEKEKYDGREISKQDILNGDVLNDFISVSPSKTKCTLTTFGNKLMEVCESMTNHLTKKTLELTTSDNRDSVISKLLDGVDEEFFATLWVHCAKRSQYLSEDKERLQTCSGGQPCRLFVGHMQRMTDRICHIVDRIVKGKVWLPEKGADAREIKKALGTSAMEKAFLKPDQFTRVGLSSGRTGVFKFADMKISERHTALGLSTAMDCLLLKIYLFLYERSREYEFNNNEVPKKELFFPVHHSEKFLSEKKIDPTNVDHVVEVGNLKTERRKHDSVEEESHDREIDETVREVVFNFVNIMKKSVFEILNGDSSYIAEVRNASDFLIGGVNKDEEFFSDKCEIECRLTVASAWILADQDHSTKIVDRVWVANFLYQEILYFAAEYDSRTPGLFLGGVDYVLHSEEKSRVFHPNHKFITDDKYANLSVLLLMSGFMDVMMILHHVVRNDQKIIPIRKRMQDLHPSYDSVLVAPLPGHRHIKKSGVTDDNSNSNYAQNYESERDNFYDWDRIHQDDRIVWVHSLLDIFTKTLEKHGVVHTLAQGSLLGAVRNGGMFYHDIDTDIQVARSHAWQLRKGGPVDRDLRKAGLWITTPKWGGSRGMLHMRKSTTCGSTIVEKEFNFYLLRNNIEEPPDALRGMLDVMPRLIQELCTDAEADELRASGSLYVDLYEVDWLLPERIPFAPRPKWERDLPNKITPHWGWTAFRSDQVHRDFRNTFPAPFPIEVISITNNKKNDNSDFYCDQHDLQRNKRNFCLEFWDFRKRVPLGESGVSVFVPGNAEECMDRVYSPDWWQVSVRPDIAGHIVPVWHFTAEHNITQDCFQKQAIVRRSGQGRKYQSSFHGQYVPVQPEHIIESFHNVSAHESYMNKYTHSLTWGEKCMGELPPYRYRSEKKYSYLDRKVNDQDLSSEIVPLENAIPQNNTQLHDLEVFENGSVLKFQSIGSLELQPFRLSQKMLSQKKLEKQVISNSV